MKNIFTPAKQKVLSALFTNLSAGWIGAIFIFPNFNELANINGKIILTLDIATAIVCLLLAFWLEERSQ